MSSSYVYIQTITIFVLIRYLSATVVVIWNQKRCTHIIAIPSIYEILPSCKTHIIMLSNTLCRFERAITLPVKVFLIRNLALGTINREHLLLSRTVSDILQWKVVLVWSQPVHLLTLLWWTPSGRSSQVFRPLKMSAG